MEHHRERNRREIDREGGEKMTRKEKVAEVMPSAINKATAGGVSGCPHHYPFLSVAEDGRECLIEEPTHSDTRFSEKCEECWNTEWLEPARPQWQQDILDKFMRVM